MRQYYISADFPKPGRRSVFIKRPRVERLYAFRISVPPWVEGFISEGISTPLTVVGRLPMKDKQSTLARSKLLGRV